MTTTPQQSGKQGEAHAETYLQKNGLTTIDKNYTCKGGEIDLIMRDGEYYVFVEVRMRNNPDFGNTLETITPQKQARVRHAVKHYLLSNGLYDKVAVRIDAVGIDRKQTVTWIKNAF